MNTESFRFGYRKACSCHPATATSGRVIFWDDGGILRATYEPGPVCDVCDRRWTPVRVRTP